MEAVLTCPFCNAPLPAGKTCRDLYNDLAFYTLPHPDYDLFIHQYIVDAYNAQHAAIDGTSVSLAAALIGLYLFCEKAHTGKQVQLAHMQLGNEMKKFPKFALPEQKATMNVSDVLKAEPGTARDRAIKDWTCAVWQIWKPQQQFIQNWIQSSLL